MVVLPILGSLVPVVAKELEFIKNGGIDTAVDVDRISQSVYWVDRNGNVRSNQFDGTLFSLEDSHRLSEELFKRGLKIS